MEGGYLTTLGDKLNEGIKVMWTGDMVVATIDKDVYKRQLVTLCSSAFGIVHRVMFFTAIGGHVVGYEHTFGVGINHELFLVFQVGQ